MSKAAKDLTTNERYILSQHPLYGVNITTDKKYEQIHYIAPVIALHHESPLDDRGLFGLDADNILNQIYITKVCDVFDAIRIARRPGDINRDIDTSLYILNNQGEINVTNKYIQMFNEYIKYIL